MKSVPFLVQHERKRSIQCSMFCSLESPALRLVCLNNTKAAHPDLGAYTGKHTPELEQKGQCIGPGTGGRLGRWPDILLKLSGKGGWCIPPPGWVGLGEVVGFKERKGHHKDL